MLSLALVTSCNLDKNDVIPDMTVDFTITFSDPEFFDLYYSPLTSVLITSAHTHLGIGTGGYDNNGIIIFNSGIEGFEYYAFDRTCPHCYVTSSTSVAVNVDGITAICPQCGTVYALASSGMPQSGPGQYYLKNYHTVYSGYSLRVWNRK